MQPSLQQWLDRKAAGPAPKRRLPKVKASRRAELSKYARILPAWKAAHPTCEVCPVIKAAGYQVRCTVKTTHPHHVKGRIGKLLYDERFFLSCCDGEGHPGFIHDRHPSIARELGLLA